jgi:hypothetical protein
MVSLRQKGETVMQKYNIVRLYKDAYPRRRTIVWGVTLEEARAHCGKAATSSRTCTWQNNPAGARRTKRLGDWFDAYESA